jgi:ATP-binding cassette, subfamily B, heavy metal transporter
MEYSYKRVFAFLYQFLKPYWLTLLISTILTGIASTTILYGAYAFSKIVDFAVGYTPGASFEPLITIIIIWALAIIVYWVATFVSKYNGIVAAERASLDADIAAVRHLSKIDIAWHDKENSGAKMRRIQRGTASIVELTKIWLRTIIEIVVKFVGAIIIISRFDRLLAVLLIVYMFIYYLISRFFRKRGVAALQKVNLKDEEVTGLYFEIISNIRSVKVLGMARTVLDHARTHGGEMIDRIKSRVFWFQGAGFGEGLWEGLIRISFITFVVWGILQGKYEVGFLVLFYGYFNSLSNSVGQFSWVAQDIDNARANIGRLTDIFDQPITIDNDDGKQSFPKSWDGIHIKNLSFTYGDTPVLSKVSFDIKKGEKIGIVGLSGAGKTTLFKLFLKEYENYEGEILIGASSLKTITKSSYIKHATAVLQETEVFNMPLRENIVLANEDKRDDQALLDRSLSIAHVTDFIPKLPQGIETKIGEKGVKLSGGEKQRLGIARAVFKEPEILFLDEATSHLDIESEQKIQDSLKKFFKDVTAVVIAHRLSTIKEMDRILVIEKGTIIESGTFDELYQQSGRFRELWDKQKI